MQTGSREHKEQICQDLIKTYQENIWKDEIYLMTLEQAKGEIRTRIAAIGLKLENKEFKSKNEGEKAKFVAEQELAAIAKEIAAVTEKITKIWPERIKTVEAYLARE